MKRVSGKRLCRALKKNGWTLIHVRGSHHKYSKSGQAPVVVPVHGNKPLKAGTQQGIMKAAGLTDEDL